MKTTVFIITMLCATAASADQYVRGHFKKDGTYQDGYMRSSPDQYKFNNYSSERNTNPYTGQRGSQKNEFSREPSYNSSYGKSKKADCYYNCKDD